jgi:hypothetical protein
MIPMYEFVFTYEVNCAPYTRETGYSSPLEPGAGILVYGLIVLIVTSVSVHVGLMSAGSVFPLVVGWTYLLHLY